MPRRAAFATSIFAPAVTAALLAAAVGIGVVLASIFALGISTAPFAAVLGPLLRPHEIAARREYAARGAFGGALALAGGALLYTIVVVATSADATERGPAAVFLYIVIVSVSLWIFALVPALVLGIVWGVINHKLDSHAR